MPYLGNEVAPLVQALEGKELKLDSDGDSSIQASTDDTVVFKTNGSNRWTLNSSGNLFPASTSQGIILGATSDTSANRLEDYEEGTWTPSLGGNTTYHSQVGKYTRVGNVVHCGAVIQANSLGTGSTTTVSGFPFTSSNSGGGYQGGDVGFYYFLATDVMSLDVQMSSGATTTAFSGRSSAGSTMATSTTVFRDGARIDFSITYYVA